MRQCEACGGELRYGKCRECGAVDQHAAPRVSSDAPSICPFDRASLHANGWCPEGEGFPITRTVPPFVCDRCRGPLTWAGTCNACERYAPGDRYDYEAPGKPGGGHWRMVEKGPFVIPDRQQQAQRAGEFGAAMARLVARMAL